MNSPDNPDKKDRDYFLKKIGDLKMEAHAAGETDLAFVLTMVMGSVGSKNPNELYMLSEACLDYAQRLIAIINSEEEPEKIH